MAHVANHTAGTHKGSGTNTIPPVLASNVAAGNTLFLFADCDNQSLTTPTVSSIAKPVGETATWAPVEDADASSSTALASVIGELWAIKTTQQWDLGFEPTVTLSDNTTAKVALLAEHSGVDPTSSVTPGTSSSSTNNASASTSGTAPTSGMLVIGVTGSENSIQSTGDTDTTNGSWSTVYGANTTGSTNISNISAVMQYKYVTADGHQTYNPALPANDSIAIVAAFQLATTAKSGDDTVSGSDTGSVAPAVTGSDTGAGADTSTVAVAPAADDTSTGADTSSTAVAITADDTATGADTAAVDTGSTAKSGDDTAAGADAASLTPALTGTDTATGADTGNTSTSADTADTSTSADTASASVTLAATDAATGVDSAFVTVMLEVTETASAADLATLANAQAASDLATLVDTASVEVPAAADVNPVTLTLRESGTSATLRESTTATLREATTTTVREG